MRAPVRQKRAVDRTSFEGGTSVRQLAFCLLPFIAGSITSASKIFAQTELDPSSLNAGVFSVEQVERGREAFLAECMECHEIEEFTGSGAFLEQQQGETLWSVFEFIWAEMPEDKPAWLEPEEYADILSYVLSVYGFPAGRQSLPIDQESLEDVIITSPPRVGG